MNAMSRPPIRELKPGFGAEVQGVDFPHATEEQKAMIVEAFQQHGAVLLRDQKMSPDDLLHFVRLFNEPEGHTLQEFTLPGYPNIYILSNKVVDGRPIGAHNDGVGWHTDYSYKEEPVMSTLLYAVEVPDEGADTLLADCVARLGRPARGSPARAGGAEAASQLRPLHAQPRVGALGSFRRSCWRKTPRWIIRWCAPIPPTGARRSGLPPAR